MRCRIYEVGISYDGRGYQDGKKIGWRDALWAFVCVVRYGLFYRPHKTIETLLQQAESARQAASASQVTGKAAGPAAVKQEAPEHEEEKVAELA